MNAPNPRSEALRRLAKSVARECVEADNAQGPIVDYRKIIADVESEFRITLREELAKLDTGGTLVDSLVPGDLKVPVSGDVATMGFVLEDDSNFDMNARTQSIRLSKAKPLTDADGLEATMADSAVERTVLPNPARHDLPQGYRLLGVLGKGGMGIVYKALHIPLNRTVAVKKILTGTHATLEQTARFQKEAEAVANLSHPNIVSVYEVGSQDGIPYFTLEYIDGQSMAQLLQQSSLSSRDAAELLLPICNAVHYSHEKGILHRDLKPQNIMITQEGVPKVADFGLAKRLNNRQAAATYAAILGSLSDLHGRRGDSNSAIALAKEAIEVNQKLASKSGDAATRYNLVLKQFKLAEQALVIDEYKLAEQPLVDAIATLADLQSQQVKIATITDQLVRGYYLQGVLYAATDRDPLQSLDQAIPISRKLIASKSTVDRQGMLLKLLSMRGQQDDALKLINQFADQEKSLMHTGYAALALGMLAKHLDDASDEQTAMVDRAVQLARRLIDLGWQDLGALRSTDLDFRSLQSFAKFQAMLDEVEQQRASKAASPGSNAKD